MSPIPITSNPTDSSITGDIFSATVDATNDLFSTISSIADADENGLVTLPDGRTIDFSTQTGYIMYSTIVQLYTANKKRKNKII